ncbi:MAG: alpha/beta fold hydrolase [Saprospiraceae bacterium]|nr:alpha/beta fold hydrolase [Saprospiraceae bacterium]
MFLTAMKISLKVSGFLLLVIFLALASFFRRDVPVDELKPLYANAYSRFLTIDGMPLHYRDEGPRADALPLVLLHGTASSLHTWDGWVDNLRHTRRCIRLDLPGHGLTGPRADRDYSVETYARTLLTLLDSLGVERCVVAGNSLGGAIAWTAALETPARVAGLILVDPAGAPFAPRHVPMGFQLARSARARPLLRWFTPRAIVARSTREVYGNPSKVTEKLIDRHYELLLRTGNRQALSDRFRSASPTLPYYPRLSEITQPVLLLWGAEDRLIPPESAAVFQKLLPNDTLVLLPGLGHVPMEEDAGETANLVGNWLFRMRNAEFGIRNN